MSPIASLVSPRATLIPQPLTTGVPGAPLRIPIPVRTKHNDHSGECMHRCRCAAVPLRRSRSWPSAPVLAICAVGLSLSLFLSLTFSAPCVLCCVVVLCSSCLVRKHLSLHRCCHLHCRQRIVLRRIPRLQNRQCSTSLMRVHYPVS